MRFVLQIPSLQHLAGVKIVAQLWSQRDVYTVMAQSRNSEIDKGQNEEEREWMAIEEKVKSKVLALPIPELCKKQLFNFIKPLGMEITYCCDYLNAKSFVFQVLDALLPHQLCWTMHGTVDHKKTAELIVRDERLNVKRRFELACFNCLENEARELFQSMGTERRRDYVYMYVLNMNNRSHGNLISFFTCPLSGNIRLWNKHFKRVLSRGESINKWIFVRTLRWGNRATCDYFFKKLQQREKEQFLIEWQEDVSKLTPSPTCNVLHFLSLMNEEQQEGLFRRCASGVLQCLLRWPMQSLFMEAAEYGWQFMNQYHCVGVFKDLIIRINDGFQDCDYSQLFWECWRLTSTEQKQYFLTHFYLEVFSLAKTKEFVQLILNHASWQHLRNLVEIEYTYIDTGRVLMDESVISDAALMECKATAALESSKDIEDEEKRLRSEQVSRLVDKAMGKKMKNRVK